MRVNSKNVIILDLIFLTIGCTLINYHFSSISLGIGLWLVLFSTWGRLEN